MTYNVFGGTWNIALSIYLQLFEHWTSHEDNCCSIYKRRLQHQGNNRVQTCSCDEFSCSCSRTNSDSRPAEWCAELSYFCRQESSLVVSSVTLSVVCSNCACSDARCWADCDNWRSRDWISCSRQSNYTPHRHITVIEGSHTDLSTPRSRCHSVADFWKT